MVADATTRCAPRRAGRPTLEHVDALVPAAAARGCTTTPRCARATWRSWRAWRGGYASRERFLTELTLDPPEATSDESGPPLRDEDYLILSTIHSAKGQEWKAVYVLNAVDGCIPSDMATGNAAEIEEERRLLYVAMTRARQHLHLMVPQRFYVTQQAERGDRHLYGSLTRFIPPALADAVRHERGPRRRTGRWFPIGRHPGPAARPRGRRQVLVVMKSS